MKIKRISKRLVDIVCSKMLVLLLVMSVSCQFTIDNLHPSFKLKNEHQYTSYLSAVLGINNDVLSPTVRLMMIEHHLSIVTAVDKIVLLLVSEVNENVGQGMLDIEGYELKRMIDRVPQKIQVMVLSKIGEQELNKMIKEYEENGQQCHVVRGDGEKVLELFNKLMGEVHGRKLAETSTEGNVVSKQLGQTTPITEAQSSQVSVPARHTIEPVVKPSTSQEAALLPKKQSSEEKKMARQTADVGSSYITKFFFIIMFIGITVGSLGLIVGMENKKDSLLYARFIADVSK